MPTNPSPEGLPSRIELPHMQAIWIPVGYWPDGSWHGRLDHIKEGYLVAERVSERMAKLWAMNAHTDALGAALESIANNTCCEGCQEAKKVARAVLEAWRSGR